MTYGEILKARRLEMKLTLEEVARHIRSHKGYVSGIENGKVNPPSARFSRLFAKALGLDETKLLMIGHAQKAPKDVREEFVGWVRDRYGMFSSAAV